MLWCDWGIFKMQNASVNVDAEQEKHSLECSMLIIIPGIFQIPSIAFIRSCSPRAFSSDALSYGRPCTIYTATLRASSHRGQSVCRQIILSDALASHTQTQSRRDKITFGVGDKPSNVALSVLEKISSLSFCPVSRWRAHRSKNAHEFLLLLARQVAALCFRFRHRNPRSRRVVGAGGRGSNDGQALTGGFAALVGSTNIPYVRFERVATTPDAHLCEIAHGVFGFGETFARKS